jgi:hypothetical protein
MAEFKPNQPIETAEARIEVEVSESNPLRPGRHRFRLVVFDDSSNASAPDEVSIIVRDSENPTAVLDAPQEVKFGESFVLLGDRSSDVGGGSVVRYVWTRVEVS